MAFRILSKRGFHASRRAFVRVGDPVPNLRVLVESSPGNKVSLNKLGITPLLSLSLPRDGEFSFLFEASHRLLIQVLMTRKVNLADEFRITDGLIIGVPGAFSGACSQQHIPSYLTHPQSKLSRFGAHLSF